MTARPTLTTVHREVMDLLTTTGLHVAWWPAETLPTAPDGRVAQFVALSPTPGSGTYARMSGGTSGRSDSVQLICGGPTIRDSLAAAEKARAALDGVRLPSGALLREDGFQDVLPAAEPGTNPIRVYTQLTYVWTTKGLA